MRNGAIIGVRRFLRQQFHPLLGKHKHVSAVENSNATRYFVTTSVLKSFGDTCTESSFEQERQLWRQNFQQRPIRSSAARKNQEGAVKDERVKTLAVDTTMPKKRKQGKLHLDRDYHVHLGGAVTKDLICEWENDGLLDLDEEIEDLVASGSSKNNNSGVYTKKQITVRRALELYRCSSDNENGSFTGYDESNLLSSYYQKPYPSLPIFLTLYRAYSRRDIIQQYASKIVERGIHSDADVRMSLPCPSWLHSSLSTSSSLENTNIENRLSPSDYAVLAIKDMEYYRDCIQCTASTSPVSPSAPPLSTVSSNICHNRRLVITIPRQTFNSTKNHEYFVAFIDLLASLHRSNETTNRQSPPLEPIFDFAGEPLPVDKTLPLLKHIRHSFPSLSRPYGDDSDSNHGIESVRKTNGCTIFYHHGEITPHIPLQQRVEDAIKLLPYIDRMGHAICLGLALQQQHQSSQSDSSKRLFSIAQKCLEEMSVKNIGIEMTPSCNLSLGGAENLNYVKMFLDAGVDVYVGTDDPGFMGSTFVEEVRLLWEVANRSP